MAKKSSRKQRGIQKGVQKHKLAAPKDSEDGIHLDELISEKYRRKLGRFAHENCWLYLMKTCYFWCLIPIHLDESRGRYELAPRWRRIAHYTVVGLYGGVMSFKLVMTAHRAYFIGMDLVTYMCACSFIVIFIAGCCASGSSLIPTRLCRLLNSVDSVLELLKTGTGHKTSCFHDVPVNLKVIFLFVIIHTAAINASFFTLIVDLPVCVLPSLQSLGLISGNELPQILMRLVILPLEILTLLPPMYATGVSTMTIALSFGAFRIHVDAVRKMPITNLESWNKVCDLYRGAQVYNGIVMKWLKIVDVPALFGSCCGVTLLLYVTIRPSGLAALIYIWFPVVAVLLMVVVTWLCYDCVIIKRMAEEIVGNLQMATKGRFFWNDKFAQKYCIRRVRSLRPVYLVVGDFSEMTLEFPMNMWDEVFNQLVFLLSL